MCVGLAGLHCLVIQKNGNLGVAGKVFLRVLRSSGTPSHGSLRTFADALPSVCIELLLHDQLLLTRQMLPLPPGRRECEFSHLLCSFIELAASAFTRGFLCLMVRPCHISVASTRAGTVKGDPKAFRKGENYLQCSRRPCAQSFTAHRSTADPGSSMIYIKVKCPRHQLQLETTSF